MALTDLGRHDPRRVGRFRVVARVGAGGMGVVYLAFDRRRRPVAVKVLRTELVESPGFRLRFQREIVAASRLEAACTARFLAGDPAADPPYFVTEYVPGPTLEAYVVEHGPLRGEALRAFAAGIAEALGAIGRAGLVHRDLKPTNVLLTPAGPKIIDFGVALGDDTLMLTQTGQRVGTPTWMAPEQASGEEITPATDVFAWGALVTFAGTGRAPFGSGTSDAVLFRVVHATPTLTGLEPSVVPLVERALSKEPEARPRIEALLAELLAPPGTGTRTDLAELLERAWPHELPAGAAPLPLPRRRHRAFVALAAVIIGVGVITGTALILQHRTPKSTSAAATRRASALRSPTTTLASTTTVAPPTNTVASTATVAAAAPETQVRIFAPFSNGGSAPAVELTAHATGRCIESEADPANSDAFRCFDDGGEVRDPCFRNGFEPIDTELVCPTSPTAPTAVGLRPTGGIEGGTAPRPSIDLADPWFLVLADGQGCWFDTGGTGPVAGRRLNYSCPNGSVFGDPDRTEPAWKVFYQANGTNDLAPVPATTAWF